MSVSSLHQIPLLFWDMPRRMFWNQVRASRWDDALKWVALLGFVAGVVWAEYAFFHRFWELLGMVPLGYQRVLPNTFSYLGAFLFGFLVYSSVLTSLTTLYRSDDLPLLIAAPVPLRLILLYKWIDVSIRSGITLVGLALPPMIALGVVLGTGWWFYVVYIVTMLALAALGTTLGMVAAMILMSLFPTRRLHQTLTILGLLFAALLITGMRFLNLETLWSESALANPLLLFMQNEPSLWVQMSPGHWFAQAILPTVLGNAGMNAWFFGTVGAGLLALTLGTTLTGSLFLKGWWKAQEQGDPDTHRRQTADQSLPVNHRVSPLGAMIRKDWTILFRDASVWTQLLMMLPLVGLYLLNLSFLPAQALEYERLFAVANVGLIALLISVIGARFLYPTASREGRAIWVPITAPVRAVGLLFQKLVFVMPPVFLVGTMMLGGSVLILDLSLPLIAWSALYAGALVFQISLLAVFLGFAMPMYDHRNLMEVSLGKGAFLYMALVLFEIAVFLYIGIRYVFSDSGDTIPLAQSSLLLWLLIWCVLTALSGLWAVRCIRRFQWMK